MNTIEFDNNGNCIICTRDISNNISFLMMDSFFNNSMEKLERDIEECNDGSVKQCLIKFRDLYSQYIDEGSLDIETVSDYSEKLETDNIEIMPSNRGSWDVIVHNISEPEHSGFWYAAQDLSRERKSIAILKHQLEACVLLHKDIDSIIALIKNSNSMKEAHYRLMACGLDEIQSKYILSFPMNRLVELHDAPITISKCERMLNLIREITD